MHHLDLRGLINPFDLLKASNAFKELKAGEIIEIIGSNPETATDLLKVLPAASCEIISSETIEEAHAGFRILLKKKLHTRTNKSTQGGCMPSITAKIHGKKFMWDNFMYSSEAEAKEKMTAYEKDGFEAACLTEAEGYLVYTRKAITEITLE